MSTDDGPEVAEPILTARQRRAPILLPVDPSDEELARDWTLSEADVAEALRCRGDANRRRFAIQLCIVRKHGRFLSEYAAVPTRVINHLCRQIRLPPVLFVDRAARDATESEFQRRIREYLGYRGFDADVQRRLEGWLSDWTAEALLPGDLFERAEALLRSWKVVLPAPSTLERIVASVASRAKQEIYDRLAGALDEQARRRIDELLEIRPGERKSALFLLKQYPPEAKPPAIAAQIARYHLVRSIGADGIDEAGVGPDVIDHLARLARRYDVEDLKRFSPEKRYAMVACFLVEARKTILDHVVAMHDQYVAGMARRSRHAFEARHQDASRRAREGLETLLLAVESLLDTGPAGAQQTSAYLELQEPVLREAIASVREFERLEDRGYLDALCARYGKLRQYFPAFAALAFEGEPGTRTLMEALDLLRRLDAGQTKRLEAGAPVGFVPSAWRCGLRRADGTLDRAVWEIALATALRDALRSGDLYLADSRRYISFSNLIYNERRWVEERERAYAELGLPDDADVALARLRAEFEQVAGLAGDGLDRNRFAEIRNGRLHLRKGDALEIPASVKELRRAIETHLPRIRIEDLLAEVDSRCAFTRHFRPLGGYEPRAGNLYATLLAALVAHGTNLGIAAMGHSADGITVDMLQHATRWFLREETLKAANAAIVASHHGLRLSSAFGAGSSSSSDGQRFGVQASTLLGSFYPRYFGYYDRAITIYTHVSDQYTVFGTQAISCAPREALYVLDGLLENDTVLRPREHYTDTHGYTEHLFALCSLLGYSFMPRLRDLPDQQLYKLERGTSHGPLDAVLRMSIDLGAIREQWDQLVRLAASLRNRTAPAHVVVGRLSSTLRSDRLSKALTALGRIVKTIHILRYVHDEEIRGRVQLQLNRGEQRHELAKWLFFANQGEFRTGDFEEVMNKASCLSLLSNAAVVWNTVEMQRIVEQLRAAGEAVSEADLSRVAPLAHAHIIANGTYHFTRAGRDEEWAR